MNGERLSESKYQSGYTEFYIQRKASGYLGNAPVWWREGNSGYSAYIENARRFSEREATSLVTKDSDKWAMFPCDFIDAHLHKVFDAQDFHRFDEWEASRG